MYLSKLRWGKPANKVLGDQIMSWANPFISRSRVNPRHKFTKRDYSIPGNQRTTSGITVIDHRLREEFQRNTRSCWHSCKGSEYPFDRSRRCYHIGGADGRIKRDAEAAP